MLIDGQYSVGAAKSKPTRDRKAKAAPRPSPARTSQPSSGLAGLLTTHERARAPRATPKAPPSYTPRPVPAEDLTRLTPFAKPAEAVELHQPNSKPMAEIGLNWTGLLAPSEKASFVTPSEVSAANQARPEPKAKVKRTYAMTWEEYDALTPEKRAAVDFNTMLVQAREKDLNADYKDKPEKREVYDQAVTEMFGEDHSSDTFAPETLAVLQDVDFRATEGESLDDFLGLKHAITVNELKNFDIDLPDPVKTSVPEYISAATTGLDTQQSLAQGTLSMQREMVKANEMLQSFRATTRASRNEAVEMYGGRPNEVTAAPGFGDRRKGQPGFEDHAFFQDAFAHLGLSRNEKEWERDWSFIAPALEQKGTMQSFLRYADERSGQAAALETDLGEGFRSPEEFRTMLGLDKRGA